jgi:opacity protein-like surface antigen
MSNRASIFCSFALTAAAAIGVATQAKAADLGSFFGGQQQEQSADAPTQPVEFGTGWYIRGDAAYAEDSLPEIGPGLAIVSQGRQPNFNADLGFGYKINDMFRADIVVDYWLPTNAQGIGAGATCITQITTINNFPEVTATDTCTPHGMASIQRLDALANGYWDIGTWYGFTPYIGAGIGMSRLQVTQDTNWYMSNGLPYHVTTDGFYYNWDTSRDTVRYQFAWAAMAGLSYQICPGLFIDAGYRYVNLGNILVQNRTTGVQSAKTIDAHEARIGLRYMIDQM